MASNATAKCPGPMKAASQGAFQGESPLDYALPLAIVQICLVVVVTRGLAYLLRPLRQPRVIAEIVVSALARRRRRVRLFIFHSYLYIISTKCACMPGRPCAAGRRPAVQAPPTADSPTRRLRLADARRLTCCATWAE